MGPDSRGTTCKNWNPFTDVTSVISEPLNILPDGMYSNSAYRVSIDKKKDRVE